MKKPDTIMIEGRAYSWRALIETRRMQLEAWKEAQPQQPALFAMHEDRRPETQRRASDRYREPGLF